MVPRGGARYDVTVILGLGIDVASIERIAAVLTRTAIACGPASSPRVSKQRSESAAIARRRLRGDGLPKKQR